MAVEGMQGDGIVLKPVSSGKERALSLAFALRATLRFHQEMGVDRYPLTPGLGRFLDRKQARPSVNQPRETKPSPTSVKERATVQATKRGAAEAQLQALRNEIEICQLCCLGSARQGVVLGAGKIGAALLVVGEYSQQQGVFSGQTRFGIAEDELLANMMRAIGLAQEDVYVTNAVKCCPLAGDAPPDESRQACRAYLMREVELVQPKVICAMGEVAARSLVGSQESVFRLRGRFHTLRRSDGTEEGRPVMITLHPRLLLKNTELKKAAWQDLQMIQRLLRER